MQLQKFRYLFEYPLYTYIGLKSLKSSKTHTSDWFNLVAIDA